MPVDRLLHRVERGVVGALPGQLGPETPPAQLDLVLGVLLGAGGVQVDRRPRARLVEERAQVRQVHDSSLVVVSYGFFRVAYPGCLA
jgi:hypothetical protein